MLGWVMFFYLLCVVSKRLYTVRTTISIRIHCTLSKSDPYSTIVNAILYEISCYIGPCLWLDYKVLLLTQTGFPYLPKSSLRYQHQSHLTSSPSGILPFPKFAQISLKSTDMMCPGIRLKRLHQQDSVWIRFTATMIWMPYCVCNMITSLSVAAMRLATSIHSKSSLSWTRIDGSMQDFGISSALAIEMLQSYTKPSIQDNIGFRSLVIKYTHLYWAIIKKRKILRCK